MILCLFLFALRQNGECEMSSESKHVGFTRIRPEPPDVSWISYHCLVRWLFWREIATLQLSRWWLLRPRLGEMAQWILICSASLFFSYYDGWFFNIISATFLGCKYLTRLWGFVPDLSLTVKKHCSWPLRAFSTDFCKMQNWSLFEELQEISYS